MDRSFGPELGQIVKALYEPARDENACLTLGKDGGLRVLYPDSVFSAVGLNNDQVHRYMQAVGYDGEKRLEFRDVDGTNLSHEELFHPVDIEYPKPMSEEKKAAMIRIVERQTEYIKTVEDQLNLTLKEKLGLFEAQNQAYRDEIAIASPELREQFEGDIRSNLRYIDEIRELINAEAAEK